MKIKVTPSLVEKLILLRDGGTIAASSLRGEWVESLLREGVLTSIAKGSRRQLRSSASPAVFQQALAGIDDALGNLDMARSIVMADSASRASQAAGTGNSKIRKSRSCPGFPVNSYQPIVCRLNGRDITVCPAEGSFLFIADWERFEIPGDVVVVGVENMDNFRLVARQRPLMEAEVSATAPLLFVSRYPQSKDLHKWLQRIPNRYVHFGDFDLAGINIFITEFQRHLGSRASLLIPADISSRLEHGSRDRYVDQYARFARLTSSDPRLQTLISLIHTHGRCYDQEGYISEAGDAG